MEESQCIFDQETRKYLTEALDLITQNLAQLKEAYSNEESDAIQEETEDKSDDGVIYGSEPQLDDKDSQAFHEFYRTEILNKIYNESELMDKTEFFEHFKAAIQADPSCVEKFRPNLVTMLKKPYYLLHSTNDLYVAKETFGNVWYICYKYLMMIDCDIGLDEGSDIQKIEEYKQFLEEYCRKPQNCDKFFMLFRSKRGIHVFLVSHYKKFNEIDSLKTMLELKGDAYHATFSYLRGYCCRLNKKNQNDLPNIYEFIGYVGSGLPLKSLMKQVMLHLDCIPYFDGQFCEITTRIIFEKGTQPPCIGAQK